jgi:BMFP domain-containing protein YqiC
MTKTSDDFAKMAQGALSVAAGLAEEARAMARAGAEALTARLDVARRDDLAATESMAAGAQATAEALETRLVALEARLAAIEAQLAAAGTTAAAAGIPARDGGGEGGA